MFGTRMRRYALAASVMAGIFVQCDPLPAVSCRAAHSAGFHDHPDNAEDYQAALFVPGRFELVENEMLTAALGTAPDAADAYLTLTPEMGPRMELECRRVRGAHGARGLSCINLPPTDLLLINTESLRFTRTSVGGWTFRAATENQNGDSIYVEYGECGPRAGPDSAEGP